MHVKALHTLACKIPQGISSDQEVPHLPWIWAKNDYNIHAHNKI